MSSATSFFAVESPIESSTPGVDRSSSDKKESGESGESGEGGVRNAGVKSVVR